MGNIYKQELFNFNMEKVQVIIVSLLIIAIIFSTISIVMNLSLGDFKPIAKVSDAPGNTNDAGGIKLVIEEGPVGAGG